MVVTMIITTIVMVFAIPAVVIEVAVMRKISPVISVEPLVVVLVIHPVAIMSMPCGISIIAISRISLLVDTYGYVYLGAGRIYSKRPCNDHRQKK
jgi:hypothetical protein